MDIFFNTDYPREGGEYSGNSGSSGLFSAVSSAALSRAICRSRAHKRVRNPKRFIQINSPPNNMPAANAPRIKTHIQR